jgi:methanogenic corrinoid protein MtbC1
MTIRSDLQAAADELGVHYQTAYRWVRSGRLRAELVNGRYMVDPASLAALASARHAPSPPPAPTPARLGRAADRVHTALIDGDEAAVSRLARRFVDEGAAVTDVIQDVFVPTLRRVGAAWQAGELTIWAEHRATAIVERVLGELTPNPRGRRRGTAVVAAVTGDRHALATTMAAVALRDDNWRVEHFGADIPVEEITQFCDDHDVSVAVITSTNPDTHELAHVCASQLRRRGTPAIVGRPGATLADLRDQARTAILEDFEE